MHFKITFVYYKLGLPSATQHSLGQWGHLRSGVRNEKGGYVAAAALDFPGISHDAFLPPAMWACGLNHPRASGDQLSQRGLLLRAASQLGQPSSGLLPPGPQLPSVYMFSKPFFPLCFTFSLFYSIILEMHINFKCIYSNAHLLTQMQRHKRTQRHSDARTHAHAHTLHTCPRPVRWQIDLPVKTDVIHRWAADRWCLTTGMNASVEVCGD